MTLHLTHCHNTPQRCRVRGDPFVEIEYDNKQVTRIESASLTVQQILGQVQSRAEEMDTKLVGAGPKGCWRWWVLMAVWWRRWCWWYCVCAGGLRVWSVGRDDLLELVRWQVQTTVHAAARPAVRWAPLPALELTPSHRCCRAAHPLCRNWRRPALASAHS